MRDQSAVLGLLGIGRQGYGLVANVFDLIEFDVPLRLRGRLRRISSNSCCAPVILHLQHETQILDLICAQRDHRFEDHLAVRFAEAIRLDVFRGHRVRAHTRAGQNGLDDREQLAGGWRVECSAFDDLKLFDLDIGSEFELGAGGRMC